MIFLVPGAIILIFAVFLLLTNNPLNQKVSQTQTTQAVITQKIDQAAKQTVDIRSGSQDQTGSGQKTDIKNSLNEVSSLIDDINNFNASVGSVEENEVIYQP